MLALSLPFSVVCLETCASLPLAPPDSIGIEEKEDIAALQTRLEWERRNLGLEHFDAGQGCFGAADFPCAYGHWRRAASMVPEWDLPLIELARLHPLYDNDRDAELAALKKAVTLNPGNPRTRFLLGVAYAQQNDFDHAEEHLRATLQLRPDHHEARFRLANLYREREKTDEAILEYESLLGEAPGKVLIHAILADLYEARGRLKDAESSLKRLTGLQGDPAYSFYKLALFYQRTGQKEKAESAFRELERLKPSDKKSRLRPLLPSRR